MEVQSINEVDKIIKLKFRISIQWMDARVIFYNLKMDETLNSLSLKEQFSLWTPTIVFWNTEKQLKTTNDNECFASIKRSGKSAIIDRKFNEDIEFEIVTIIYNQGIQYCTPG